MASIPTQSDIASLDYQLFGDVFIPNKIDSSQANIQSLDYQLFGDVFVADYQSGAITTPTIFMLWYGNDDLT